MFNAFKDALRQDSDQHLLIDGSDPKTNFDRLSVTAAIVWQPPKNFFDGLINLTHVFALAAGVDQLLKHAGLPTNATIVRLKDAGMAAQMAEYVLYGVLRAQRRFHEFDVAQTTSTWAHGKPVRSACDTHVGILGAGVLAQAVASRLVLNGYTTHCWGRTEKTLPEKVSGAFGADALSAFLAQCDVLVCLLALTDETRGIVNTKLMMQLPNGAYIINCARGEHVVDVDLLNAIDNGHLSGAMLDVFHKEPLPENHPFWTHPQVLVTPHEAARSLVNESVGQIMCSIKQVMKGEAPDGLVDRLRGY